MPPCFVYVFGSLDGPNTVGHGADPEAERVWVPPGVDPADCALHMTVECASEAEASALALRARALLEGARMARSEGWFAADFVDVSEAVSAARRTRH